MLVRCRRRWLVRLGALQVLVLTLVLWTSAALAQAAPADATDAGAPTPAAPAPSAEAARDTPPAADIAELTGQPLPAPDVARGELPQPGLDGARPIGGARLRQRAQLPPLVWRPEYKPFDAVDAVVTAAGLGVTLAMSIVPPIEGNRRQGGVLFDEAVRDGLRVRNFSGRYVARDASDVLLSLTVTHPFFIDAMATAWWFRGNAYAARQMALIDIQAFALASMVQGITNVAVARERPYGRDCGGELSAELGDCTRARRYRSFFSGHATLAFTSAGLICAHHMQLRLLGDGPGDAMSCALGFVAAGATGTLRIVGDMHYASDVLLGAVNGTLFGLGIPWLHYNVLGNRPTKTRGPAARNDGVQFSVVPNGMGLGLAGTF